MAISVPQDRHHVVLIASGTLGSLLSLARPQDDELEIQRFAVFGIANLASSVDIHPHNEEGMLPILISLSNAPDSEVRLYSSSIIASYCLPACLLATSRTNEQCLSNNAVCLPSLFPTFILTLVILSTTSSFDFTF